MPVIKLRIMADQRQDIRDFADLMESLPQVEETDSVTICPNYKGSGFRGYLTVVMKNNQEEIATCDYPPENVRPAR